jgi:hypothetical protein
MYIKQFAKVAKNSNEMNLVRCVVNSATVQSYNGVKIFAAIIHGSHAFVGFDFMNTRVTKELY